MLFFIAGQIVIGALGRLINPVLPAVTAESLIALIATLCINVFVSVYEYRQGRKLNSDILISDSMHTRSDIFVSAGVLVTLVCIRAGLPPIIDPIASLAVAAFIFRAAFEIFSAESRVLVDTIAIDDGVVRKIVMGFPQVRDAHEIRSRGRTDDVHVDLHIMTDSQMSVAESHALIHEIESKLQRELNQNIQVIVHLEPYQSARDGSSAC
jgi:cation diffusion facilitator family transporter